MNMNNQRLVMIKVINKKIKLLKMNLKKSSLKYPRTIRLMKKCFSLRVKIRKILSSTLTMREI